MKGTRTVPLARRAISRVSALAAVALVCSTACALTLAGPLYAGSAPNASQRTSVDSPIRLAQSMKLGYDLTTPCSGDFDGDGIDDLAAWNTATSRVVLFAGSEQHALENSSVVTLQSGDVLAAAADLDGDTRTDLVARRSADSTIAVYRSLGGGAFAGAVRYAAGAAPYSVLPSDMTGDHAQDLVVLGNVGSGICSVLSEAVLVFVNDGTGAFGPPVRTPGLWITGVGAVGDLNGDLRDDLVLRSMTGDCSQGFSARALRVLLSEGDGTFVMAPEIGLPEGNALGALAIGDLDGNGTADLVQLSTYFLRGYSGSGDGTFVPAFERPEPIHFGASASRSQAWIVDVDRNGRPEIALGFRGGGGGQGGYPRLDLVPLSPAGSPLRDLPYMMDRSDNTELDSAEATGGAIGDFDDDGSPDFALTFKGSGPSGRSSLSVAFVDGARGPVAPLSIDLEFVPRDVAIARIRPDGGPDLLVFDGAETMSLRNLGYPHFAPPLPFAPGRVIWTKDLNGDGADDLVLASHDSVMVHLSDGSGSLSPPTLYTGATVAALADFDGVHGRDLAVSDAGAHVLLRLNDGTGHFGPPTDTGLLRPGSAGAADLDGDGLAELILVRPRVAPHDSIAVHWNLGTGFSVGTRYEVAPPAFSTDRTAVSTIEAGDFDGNGLPDLAVVNAASGDHFGGLSIFMNQGGRVFAPSVDYATTKDPWEGAVSDLDRDGRDDAIVICDLDIANGRLEVFGAGPGGVLEMLPGDSGIGFTTEHYPTSVAVGDLDGDQRPDILVNNQQALSLTMYRNVTPPSTPTAVVASLISAEADPNEVRLAWYWSLGSGATASVQRLAEGGAWESLGRASADGDGRLAWTDRAIEPGSRYAYRLAWSEGGASRHSQETWIDVPMAAGRMLAIRGSRPNPSSGSPVIAFQLPDGAPASLEVYDVAGRRVYAQRWDAPAPGEHVVRLDLARTLGPGLYLARLAQSGKTVTSRFAVVE